MREQRRGGFLALNPRRRESKTRSRLRRSIKWGIAAVGTATTAALTTILAGTLSNTAEHIVAPRASPSATASRSPDLPLSYVLVHDETPDKCIGHAIPKQPSRVPAPGPDSDNSHSWALALGGIDYEQTSLRLTIQGRADEDVVLQRLRVRVTARGNVAPSSIYFVSYGCGGVVSPRYFNINLTARPARITSQPATDEQGKISSPAVHFPLKVSRSDPEVFLLYANLQLEEDLSWELLLDWTSAGRTGTEVLRSSDGPLRTLGARNGVPEYVAMGTGWQRGGDSIRG